MDVQKIKELNNYKGFVELNDYYIYSILSYKIDMIDGIKVDIFMHELDERGVFDVLLFLDGEYSRTLNTEYDVITNSTDVSKGVYRDVGDTCKDDGIEKYVDVVVEDIIKAIKYKKKIEDVNFSLREYEDKLRYKGFYNDKYSSDFYKNLMLKRRIGRDYIGYVIENNIK